ncbi:hypothetical protein OR620_06915 [Aeromonas hydrophila]|uniref:hypothetical protein n=1 Tax=Aeromonas TaxID=642 RepID=UPI00111A242D|nr:MULTISPECIES: hypothetical protein [Aeromonas]MCX4103506.1 hypothetical protein [Aeromonas hydrophila]
MKYYLETNALRALGSKIGSNKNLLSQSYTSTFSLFELAKGINRRTDTEKRIKLLSTLASFELKVVEALPLEIIKAAYSDNVCYTQSDLVISKINDYFSDKTSSEKDYDALVENYEFSTKEYQIMIDKECAKPKPEPQYVTLDLNKILSPSEFEIPQSVRDLPKGTHPSRYFMEYIRKDFAIATFHSVYGNVRFSDQKILDMYNNKLDIYFFAVHAFELRKHSLRELAKKNDLLDLFHTAYLFEYDSMIVSDDKIYESILPEFNVMSVSDYKKLI